MRILLAILLMCVSLPVFGDDRPDKHGIYRLADPSERYTGTAFVVKASKDRVYLATAAHVVCPDDGNKTIYSPGYDYPVRRNDRSLVGKVKVLMVAADADLALMEGLFTVDVDVMDIDTDPVPTPKRDYLPPRKPGSVLGYANGTWTETTGYLSFVSGNKLKADIIAIGGQSGGPVVSDGKVVGVCSGGDVWFYEDADKKTGQFTWPLRAGNGKRLKEMMGGLK